uniref:Uncharacterized protein n=1 Tax=Arundo donax TaxID=35708 RepID=A0A0A9GRR3_ARUDO
MLHLFSQVCSPRDLDPDLGFSLYCGAFQNLVTVLGS